MKILIDIRRKVNSGIGRVSQWLANNLNDELIQNVEFYFLATNESIKDYKNLQSESILLSSTRPFSFDDLYDIPKQICQGNFDLYINPQVYSSPFNIVKTVNFVHDLWPLFDEDWLPSMSDVKNRFNLDDLQAINAMSNWLNDEKAKLFLTDYGYEEWKSISNNIGLKYVWSQYTATAILSTHICVVSKDTEKYFKKYFNRKLGISCIPLGLNSKWKNVVRKKPKHFLNLAKLEPRKNVSKLIDAYELYCKSTKNPYPLIIAGDPGYREYANNILEKINKMNEQQLKISFLDSISDEKIAELFSESAALIFPSKFEGFGLPPLEAMSSGVPVIASITGMMATELGNNATLLKTDNPKEIASCMMDLTINPTHYEEKAIIARKEITKKIYEFTIKEKWINLIKDLII